jgi:hypothetical protein
MANYWVPYAGDKPATLSINGHNLIILSQEEALFDETLTLVGADHIERLGGDSTEEDETILNALAEKTKCGVVVAPSDVAVPDIIDNLREQLPWLQ